MGYGVSESVVEFGPGNRLVGILSHGTGTRRDPAVVITNSGIIHRAGANRLHVRLARRLAEAGYTVLRYDLPGLGDSEVIPGASDIRQMNLQGTRAALDELSRRGIADTFVMVGLCSGADHSFAVALQDERVVGAVLIDPTALVSTRRHRLNQVLRTARRGLRPRVWIRLLRGRYQVRRMIQHRSIEPPRMGMPTSVPNDPTDPRRNQILEALRVLTGRGVRIRLVITGHSKDVYSYAGQMVDAFPEIPELRRCVSVSMRPQATHTFSDEVDRRFLEQEIEAWLSSIPETTQRVVRTASRGHAGLQSWTSVGSS